MTEFLPAAEVPKTDEDRQSILRRAAAATGRIAVENAKELKEIFSDDSTRRIAGGLAILGAASTAAEYGHWFDHTDVVLEFIQGSGRHFLVGYLGAKIGIAKSKAETMQGKIVAGLTGAFFSDVLTEAAQSGIMTGLVHHGSMHDVMSFASKKEIFWGNAKDDLAAEMAVAPALAVEP